MNNRYFWTFLYTFWVFGCRGDSNNHPKHIFSCWIIGKYHWKDTWSADFLAGQIDVIKNFAIITNVIIKRVHCTQVRYKLTKFLLLFQPKDLWYFSYFSAKTCCGYSLYAKTCCGYSLEAPHMFSSRNQKNIYPILPFIWSCAFLATCPERQYNMTK